MILDLILYYGIAIAPTLLLYRTRNLSKSNLKYRISIMAACIIPAFFYGVRYKVGTDWNTYFYYYQSMSGDVSWKDTVLEPGYFFLSMLCKSIGLSFYGFSFICCCLIEIALLKALDNFKLKNTLWLGYYLSTFTIYFVAYNITRQMMATAFLILAYTYYKSKEKKKFIIFLLVAILFHKTAILGIAIVIICKLYDRFSLLGKFKTFFSTMVLSCVGILAAGSVILFIQKLGFYASPEYRVHAVEITEFRFLAYYIPEWIIVYIHIRRKANVRLFECYALFMLSSVFQVLACVFPYVDRLSWYFVSFRILLYPMILMELNGKFKLQFCILSIVWFLFYFFVMFYMFTGNGLFPYTTVYQQ